MKKSAILFTILALWSTQAKATSLDEIYRDLIKSDNEGYLPLYVKNRQAPDILVDKDIKEIPDIEQAQTPDIDPYIIDLIDRNKLAEQARLAQQKKWQETLKAVQENRVTPYVLEEILKHVRKHDPKAVEVYAWMNTKGIGVPKDYNKAFYYYQEAAYLAVPDAEKNAAAIYKVLTAEQRKQVKAYIPPEKEEEEETTQSF